MRSCRCFFTTAEFEFGLLQLDISDSITVLAVPKSIAERKKRCVASGA